MCETNVGRNERIGDHRWWCTRHWYDCLRDRWRCLSRRRHSCDTCLNSGSQLCYERLELRDQVRIEGWESNSQNNRRHLANVYCCASAGPNGCLSDSRDTG